MKNWRLFWNSVLISLPAAMLVAAVVYFLVDKVPEFARNEEKRIQQEYRDKAVAAKEAGKGEVFDFATSGYRRGNLSIKREPWGFEVDKVWYFKDGRAYRITVEPVEGFDFRTMFYSIGVLVALLFIAMTVFGVRYFWKFVQSRDDFLAATAHDLTTPLVGMRMMIGRCDDEAKKLNERMLLIVNNIKDFMRLGGQRRQPELKPVDIVALTKEAYRLFAADYEDSESGAVEISDFKSQISDCRESGSECGAGDSECGAGDSDCRAGDLGEAMAVHADETMTLQILWNLFGNDLKYAAPYGKVAVRFAQEDGFVRVEFVDEGQGMTPGQMKRAFDRYYRARTVLESGKGGFGIGLCTAREFARAMGGDLTVRANSPKGCVFSLRLPLAAGSRRR